MNTPKKLHIRLARPNDRDAVTAMVATVWNGNDYVPTMWDEWLNDSSGPLLVGEIARHPVALAKLSQLGPGEEWFHGLRIAPDQRGRGYARAMLRRCIELSRARAACTLRYMTDEENGTMHRLGAELGFRLAYAPIWCNAPLIAAKQLAQPLPPAYLPTILSDLSRSPLLAHTNGLYSYNWRTFAPTIARLRTHLERNEIVAIPGDDAWAIRIPRKEGGGWLAHIEGTPPAITRLCHALRSTPTPDETAQLRILMPPTAPCVDTLLAAGFNPTDDRMRVYELHLT